MKIFNQYFSLLFLSIALLISCGDDSMSPETPKPEKPSSVQVDYSQVRFQNLLKVSKQQIKTNFEQNEVLPEDTRELILPIYTAEKITLGPISIPLTVSGVRKEKVTYQTLDAKGKPITVSGAVVFPDTPRDDLPMLIYLHGTEDDKNFSYAELVNSDNELNQAVDLFASLGLVVVFPDYIGYGESKDTPHPYEHAETLGGTGADMLEAVKYHFNKNPKLGTLSSKVFITGYSEGGYAAMALHKRLEEKHPDISIIKTVAGAGAYDKPEFGRQIFQTPKDTELNFLHSYLWVLAAYKDIYPEGADINYQDVYTADNYKLFKDNDFPFIYQGTIDLNFSKKPAELFKKDFRDQIENKDSPLFKILSREDLTRWKPKAPLLLVTGDADDYVYPINTANAFNRMTAQGAPVTRKIYPGKTHGTAVPLYLTDTFNEVLPLVVPAFANLLGSSALGK